jgi:hypothetical protein
MVFMVVSLPVVDFMHGRLESRGGLVVRRADVASVGVLTEDVGRGVAAAARRAGGGGSGC